MRLYFSGKIFLLLLLWVPVIPAAAQQTDPVDTSVEVSPPSLEDYEKYKEEQEDEDQDPDYFLEKTANGSVRQIEPRKVPEERIKDLKNQKAFWYADAVFERKKPRGSSLAWLRTLLWLIIIAGFASFLVIYLAGSNVGLFRKKDRTLREREEEELITEDIFAINYQKEIEKAVAQGNFRLAVRLMYLRLLRELSEKNIIRYTQDKTNFDYLLQLHPTPYYKDFFRITRHYEYSWYGQFDVSENAYRLIRQDVHQFEREFRLH